MMENQKIMFLRVMVLLLQFCQNPKGRSLGNLKKKLLQRSEQYNTRYRAGTTNKFFLIEMKILYWNARDLGILETHKSNFVFLSESWILIDQFPS